MKHKWLSNTENSIAIKNTKLLMLHPKCPQSTNGRQVVNPVLRPCYVHMLQLWKIFNWLQNVLTLIVNYSKQKSSNILQCNSISRKSNKPLLHPILSLLSSAMTVQAQYFRQCSITIITTYCVKSEKNIHSSMSEWVLNSFLMAYQHTTGYLVPRKGCRDVTVHSSVQPSLLTMIMASETETLLQLTTSWETHDRV